MSADTSHKLRALPVQLVPVNNGAILKRGCTEVRITGEGAADILELVLSATASKGATQPEIREHFAAPLRPAVDHIIQQLIDRRLLVPVDDGEETNPDLESSLDLFYWHFGEASGTITERLNSRQLAILGVNGISLQIALAFHATGIDNFQVVDYPLLRNLRLFDESGILRVDQWCAPFKPPVEYEAWEEKNRRPSFDCLIATSDFGNASVFRQWNEHCVKHDRCFLPVVLQNLIGYVGPLVIPGETACFECLRARQNSHMSDPEAQRAVENVAFQSQVIVGFHPSMASILGHIAAFELTKFYSGAVSKPKVGTVLEVNLLDTELRARKVLKVPRCLVCSPLKKRSSVTPYRNAFTLSNLGT